MFNSYLFALAASETAADPAQSPTGSLIYSLVMLGIVLLLMYLMVIRPQKKKDKEQKEMRDALQIGDQVTTIGGIVGFIVRKNEDTVVIETGGDRSKIIVKLWAISENQTKHDESDELGKKK